MHREITHHTQTQDKALHDLRALRDLRSLHVHTVLQEVLLERDRNAVQHKTEVPPLRDALTVRQEAPTPIALHHQADREAIRQVAAQDRGAIPLHAAAQGLSVLPEVQGREASADRPDHQVEVQEAEEDKHEVLIIDHTILFQCTCSSCTK